MTIIYSWYRPLGCRQKHAFAEELAEGVTACGLHLNNATRNTVAQLAPGQPGEEICAKCEKETRKNII